MSARAGEASLFFRNGLITRSMCPAKGKKQGPVVAHQALPLATNERFNGVYQKIS